MPKFRIAGAKEKAAGIYYEFDSDDRPLGEGGMGKVYKGFCVNERSGQSYVVAVKFLKEDAANNPYVVEKARREAELRFKHVNLIEMYGFVETEQHTPYDYKPIHHFHVVSELLIGVSLSDLLAGRLLDQQGNFMPYAETLYKEYRQEPERFAVKIIKNVLSGLMCMHDAGYIHRDIDPSNVMITSDGKIKLIDYGIAKQINSLTTNDKHMTKAGEFVGKPEYAAPELILGEINEQNQTTDIYAVGILLFQCIVGHLPFEGDRTKIIQMQLQKQPPLHLIKNKKLRKIIKRAMEKDRADRFQSSAEFRVALDGIVLDDGTKPVWKYIISATAAVVVITVGIVVYNILSSPPPPSTDPIAVVDTIKEKNKEINSICEATALLDDKETAKEGYDALCKLSEKDSEAAFVLSRIRFDDYDEDEEEKLPDSIVSFQRMLKSIDVSVINNNIAHDLLEQAVKLDKSNFYAQCELGLDYYHGKNRVPKLESPNFDKAAECFLEVIKNNKGSECSSKSSEMVNRIISRHNKLGEKEKAENLEKQLNGN